jgi:hypothetical protein
MRARKARKKVSISYKNRFLISIGYATLKVLIALKSTIGNILIRTKRNLSMEPKTASPWSGTAGKPFLGIADGYTVASRAFLEGLQPDPLPCVDDSAAVESLGEPLSTGRSAEPPNAVLLLRRLEKMAEPDLELSAWLGQGLDRWRSGEPLDHALGLAGADAIRARNAALVLAAGHFDESDLSTWELAGRLEAAIRRFESIVLPRIRRGEAVSLDPAQQAILSALEAGAGMIRSRRRLWDLLR